MSQAHGACMLSLLGYLKCTPTVINREDGGSRHLRLGVEALNEKGSWVGWGEGLPWKKVGAKEKRSGKQGRSTFEEKVGGWSE